MKKAKNVLLLLALLSCASMGTGLTACSFGETDSSSSVSVESSALDFSGEKDIVCSFPETASVYSVVDIGACYGTCNGMRFACSAEITTPSGKKTTETSKYTLDEEGFYTIALTSKIGTESAQKTVTLTTEGYSAQGLFTCSNAKFLQDGKKLPKNVQTDIASGTQFKLESSNSSVSFRPVVDLNALDGGSLIEFTANLDATDLPELQGLRIVLTDVYDSSNTVGISFTMNNTIMVVSKQAALENGTSASPSLKAEWNGYAIGDSSTYTAEWGKTYLFDGSMMPTFWEGTAYEAAFVPLNVYFDNAENKVYTKTRSGGDLLVYDLDDPTDSYTDFKGFTTGEVYVRIETTGTSGDVVVTKLGNYRFDTITQSSYQSASDALLFGGYDFENMVTGAVGYSYPLAQSLFSEKVTTELYKLDEETTEMLSFNGTFVPSEAGIYQVVYKAKNQYGYEESTTGVFEILSKPTEIEAEALSLDAKLFDVFTIPEVPCGGGSGVLQAKYVLQKGAQNIETQPGDAFTLDTKGENTVLHVTVTDEIGYSKTFDYPVSIDNDVLRFELVGSFDDVTVPKGTSITVPDYIAIDYSQDDTSKNNVEVSIKRGKRQILEVGDTLQIDSDTIIKYYIGEESEPIKELTIRCQEAFTTDSDVSKQFSVVKGIRNVTTATIGSAFTLAESNAEIKMPYGLSVTDLNLSFSVFEDMLNSAVTVRVTAMNGRELTYTLTNLGSLPTLSINGKSTYAKVSVKKYTYKDSDLSSYFNREYYTYSFIVDGSKSIVCNGEGLQIATIDTWNNGLPFDGFEKGVAQVRFEIEKATEGGAFVLGKVSNQGMTSIHLNQGEKIAPMIAFTDAFRAGLVQKDSKVNVPMAYAYDVFDATSEVKMSLITPSGNYLLKNIAVTEYSFTASEYGRYTLKYELRDSKGNMDTITYRLIVSDDVAPVISVDGTYQEEYKGKVQILSATATDNVDGALEVSVWIEDASKTARFVTAGETVSLSKGVYRIVYYTMDENGNFATLRYTITVK